jgi:hypothetical protein
VTPRFHHPNRLPQIREFANPGKSIWAGGTTPIDPRSSIGARSCYSGAADFSLRLRPGGLFFYSVWVIAPNLNDLRSLTLFAKSAAGARPRWRSLRRSNYRNAIRSLLYDRMVSELDDKKTRNLGFRRRFRLRSFGVNRNYQRVSALCFGFNERKNFRMCRRGSQKIGGTSIIYTFCILLRSSNYFLRMIR